MAKRIDKLTATQEAAFADYVERWTAIGLCTSPADRPEAETAIRRAYRLAGIDEPERVVWCGSPLSQALTRATVRHIDDAGDSVQASVRASVRASAWDSVGASVRASVRASVGDSVAASVAASVRASVGASVYGQHDAAWLAFYAFFREQCGLTRQTDKLAGLIEYAKHAGWALPHQRICWLSERHHTCSLDDRQLIHSDTGPAIAYPDGWKIWAWHGVRVPQKVIEAPGTLTVPEIRDEQNTEVRRVMLERFGPDRFMLEQGGRLVQQDDYGKLWRADLRDDEPLVLVELENATVEPDGSVKRYWLRVPPDVETAQAAAAWTFDMAPADYVLAQAS